MYILEEKVDLTVLYMISWRRSKHSFIPRIIASIYNFYIGNTKENSDINLFFVRLQKIKTKIEISQRKNFFKKDFFFAISTF